MDFAAFWNYDIWTFGNYRLSVLQLVSGIALIVAWIFAFRWVARQLVPKLLQLEYSDRADRKKIIRLIYAVLVVLGLILLTNILGLNFQIYPLTSDENTDGYALFLNTLLRGLLIIQLARLADWGISEVLMQNYLEQRKKAFQTRTAKPTTTPKEKSANSLIQPIAFGFALLFLINIFELDRFLSTTLTLGNLSIAINPSNLLFITIILFIARLIVWIIVQLILHNYYIRNNINTGTQYAINKLIQYIIFVLAIFAALHNIGLQLTVVWGSIAALLVGVGLGLQQTFNDWISGIILLLERSVEVGQVIEVDGMVGTVKHIGLRVSKVQTLDNIAVLIPNSKLVNENVINWSDFDSYARFNVSVGIAYGSDTALVKKLLLQIAQRQEKILKFPAPSVRFKDFGSSSLDFELLFYVRDFTKVENIKSELRFQIDAAFRENDINIPFPQMDVWLKEQ